MFLSWYTTCQFVYIASYGISVWASESLVMLRCIQRLGDKKQNDKKWSKSDSCKPTVITKQTINIKFIYNVIDTTNFVTFYHKM